MSHPSCALGASSGVRARLCSARRHEQPPGLGSEHLLGGRSPQWPRLPITTTSVIKIEIPPYGLVKSCFSESPRSPTPTADPATLPPHMGSPGPCHDPAAKRLMLGTASSRPGSIPHGHSPAYWMINHLNIIRGINHEDPSDVLTSEETSR